METARLKIINVATELFLHYGFKSVTMDDIAFEGHLSKKTIYEHFQSKEQLISAVLHELERMIRKQMDHILFESGNSIEAFFNLYRYFFLEQCNRLTAIWTLKKYYPVQYSLFNYGIEKLVYEKVGGVLEKGIEEVLFIPVLEIRPFCCLLLSVSASIITNAAISHGDDSDPEVLVKDLIYYSLRSVVTPSGLLLLENINENKMFGRKD